MKPQNIDVRRARMGAGREVWSVTFTVYRDMPGATPDQIEDQENQVCAAVEALEIDMGEPDERDEPCVVARDKDGRCFDVPRASLCRCGFVHAAGERCGPW